MNSKSLYEFYSKVLLPQFGFEGEDIHWRTSADVGPNESVHYFSIGETEYALLFEDAGGLWNDIKFVKDHVKLKRENFEYIQPVSFSDISPSYPIMFPAPFQYCENITGKFTLIKI